MSEISTIPAPIGGEDAPIYDQLVVEYAAKEDEGDYYTARRDAEGNIRLNQGRGMLVAMRYHSRRHVEVWLQQATEEKWRRTYQAAVDLWDREDAERGR